jgi:hypothetical protein
MLRRARVLASLTKRAEQEENSNAHLAELLLEKWTQGYISATQLIEFAAAASRDQPKSDATRELGNLGHQSSTSRTMNNTQRDLLRLLAKRVPDFHEYPEPTKHFVTFTGFRDGLETRNVELPIAPLHRAFAHLYRKHRDRFWKVWGTSAMAKHFWENIRPDDKNLAQWTSKLANKDLRKVLLFSIHGDGVPVFKHKSLMVWSAMSLLGIGKSREMKHLWTAYWSHLRSKTPADSATDTERAIWQVLEWDLNALFAGVHPLRNWKNEEWPAGSEEARLAGHPLAEGFCAMPLLLKGDLDHVQKVLGLEATTGLKPCPFCDCDRQEFCWTDCRASAPWKNRLFWHMSRPEWEAKHPDRHPVFNVLGMSHCSLFVDVQHDLALGVAQHAGGSALELMVFHGPGTAKQNLANVWLHVNQWYKETKCPCRIRKIHLSMFHKPNKFPSLTTKAKETEFLISALLWTWGQLCDLSDPRDQSVSAALRCLEIIFAQCRRVGPDLKLAQENIEIIQETVDMFLQQYTALGQHAQDQHLKLWNFVPKCHILWHLAFLSDFVHPAVAACYADEDFVGVVKRIAGASTAGKSIEFVADALLTKVAIGKAIHYAKNDRPLVWKSWHLRTLHAGPVHSKTD